MRGRLSKLIVAAFASVLLFTAHFLLLGGGHTKAAPVATDTTIVGPTAGVELSPGYHQVAGRGTVLMYTSLMTNTGETTDTATASSYIYLPLLLRDYVAYFEGPWEREDNDSYLQANGPLRSDRDYYGYPDDAKDYFSIYPRSSGDIAVDLTDHKGQGVQLSLFYQSPATEVGRVWEKPYHIEYTGPAGWYYIYIYTESGYDNTVSYTLRTTYNNPPHLPSDPAPADGATNQSVNVDLGWTSGDPDAGDSVTYAVYLEANDNTPDVLICNGVTNTSCNPGTLSRSTHYYWQVVARDEHEATSTGPVWDFATQGVVLVVGARTADGNWNPKTTFVPGDPIQWIVNVENTTGGDAEVELTYDARGPNGEQVTYWNGVVTTEAGAWSWGLPGTVPRGMSGTHTFTGTGLYQGILTQAATTYSVTEPSIGMIETGSYQYPYDRLDGLGYSVSLLPMDAGIDIFRQYEIIYLPVGWADGSSGGDYSQIEAHAADYRTYVSEGGGLFVDQPNPFRQPDESVSPTLLPYPITFYNPYNSNDWPPIIVNQDHYITNNLSREDMPGPADQIIAIDSAYEVLVRGQVTDSPSLAVAEYGQGRVVVQTDHSGTDHFGEEVYRRMIEWVSSDVESVSSRFHLPSGPTPALVKEAMP